MARMGPCILWTLKDPEIAMVAATGWHEEDVHPPASSCCSSLLGLCPEIRLIVYTHLFRQPNNEILALSREPEHDYSKGPPSDWIADSRQEGLVYNTDAARVERTNAGFLRTCRTISNEATPIFYSQNRIKIYAEDNNDIFYWLLDIGEHNRRAIRHIDIDFAYGVCIASGRGNIHGIMETIDSMEDSEEEEIQKKRRQLISIVQRLELKTVRLIIRTLNLLATNQDLVSLSVFLPGVDGGDIWDVPNENIYFSEEIFSNSTSNVHACIPEALTKMYGIETLTIGYTKDIVLADQIARATGAKEVVIRTCPEAHSLNLDNEERAIWMEKGWQLLGQTAHKILVDKSMDKPVQESQRSSEVRKNFQKSKTQHESSHDGYSEGGRLKADMEF